MKNFKLLLWFLFYCGIVNVVHAQEFYGGVLGGINGTQVEGDASSGYLKLGLSGGVWFQREISDDFFWGAEMKFIQKGSRKIPSYKHQNYDIIILRYDYIELPVIFGYTYKDYRFFAGLSYNQLVHKRKLYNGEDMPVDITNWELGILAGIKVRLQKLINRTWAENFTLDTRLQYSAFSIDKNHDFFMGNKGYLRDSNYNNVISTTLFYRIEWNR
ncbi:MAG TPA: outer membrane beta-barrel protein [Prolixibacteraceae bacterium]|nr:outer membrane beta-barrel protein [Prolixibacteraceae bacterium]